MWNSLCLTIVLRYLNNSFMNLTIVCLEKSSQKKAPAHDVIMKPALIRSIPHIRSHGFFVRSPVILMKWSCFNNRSKSTAASTRVVCAKGANGLALRPWAYSAPLDTAGLRLIAIQEARVNYGEPFALCHQRLLCTVGAAGRVPCHQPTLARRRGWQKPCPRHTPGRTGDRPPHE